MKKLFLVGIAVIVVLSACAGPVPSEKQKDTCTTSTDVSLLTAPDGNEVSALPKGEVLTRTGERIKGDSVTWVRVQTTEGVTGWVIGRYCRTEPKQTKPPFTVGTSG